MLTHDTLDTQAVIELPAREMLAFFNWANVVTQQANYNLQVGAVNVNGGQLNQSLVIIGQS
jgi:hypothetical protein